MNSLIATEIVFLSYLCLVVIFVGIEVNDVRVRHDMECDYDIIA